MHEKQIIILLAWKRLWGCVCIRGDAFAGYKFGKLLRYGVISIIEGRLGESESLFRT